MQELMRRFRGAGGSSPDLAEPGSYILTLTLGDRSLTQTLEVTRAEGYAGKLSAF